MSRPKFARYGITIGNTLSFLEGLLAVALFVEITGKSRGCDDPDDDAIIETAEVGAANYLITGDSDLLDPRIRESLGQRGIEVVTASHFLRCSFASLDSAANIIKGAQMIVAAEVGGAIAVSSWQVAELSRQCISTARLIESALYDLMVSFAAIRKRVVIHANEVESVRNCNDEQTNCNFRRSIVAADRRDSERSKVSTCEAS